MSVHCSAARPAGEGRGTSRQPPPGSAGIRGGRGRARHACLGRPRMRPDLPRRAAHTTRTARSGTPRPRLRARMRRGPDRRPAGQRHESASLARSCSVSDLRRTHHRGLPSGHVSERQGRARSTPSRQRTDTRPPNGLFDVAHPTRPIAMHGDLCQFYAHSGSWLRAPYRLRGGHQAGGSSGATCRTSRLPLTDRAAGPRPGWRAIRPGRPTTIESP